MTMMLEVAPRQLSQQERTGLRAPSRDKLLYEFQEFAEASGFGTNTTHRIRVNRATLAQPFLNSDIDWTYEQKWRVPDAIWNISYPGGNIPLEDQERDLAISTNPYGWTIGSEAGNINFGTNLNSPSGVFTTEIRPLDRTRPYENLHLVNLAKDVLVQSKSKFKIAPAGYNKDGYYDPNASGREYDSYRRQHEETDNEGRVVNVIPYDISNPVNVARDYQAAKISLNLLRVLSQ